MPAWKTVWASTIVFAFLDAWMLTSPPAQDSPDDPNPLDTSDASPGLLKVSPAKLPSNQVNLPGDSADSILNDAYRMGLLSRAAYFDQDKAGNTVRQRRIRSAFLAQADFEEVHFRQGKSRSEQAEALVARSKNGTVLVLSIAGVDFKNDPVDIITILRSTHGSLSNTASPLFPLDYLAKVRIHSGFRDYADAIWNESGPCSVREIIGSEMADTHRRPIDSPPTELWITGHSMGGAVAQILAAYFAAAHQMNPQNPQVSRIITFGSPMVGNSSWKALYEKHLNLSTRTERWIYRNDPAPRFPPPSHSPDQYCASWVHAGRAHLLVIGIDRPVRFPGPRNLNPNLSSTPFSGYIGSNSLLHACLRGESFDHAAELIYIDVFQKWRSSSGAK